MGTAKVKRRRRGDMLHRYKAVLTEKWWAYKTWHSPYDLLEVIGLRFVCR